MKCISIPLACIALAACFGGNASGDEELTAETEFTAPEGDAMDESGEEERGGETYDEYETRRDELDGEMGTYAGDGYTEDCSGHEAGYQWAMENGITDPDTCGGNSWSFIEGCRA